MTSPPEVRRPGARCAAPGATIHHRRGERPRCADGAPRAGGRRFDVAIVGSGFAGSILARCLAARGRRVVLVERGRHPRFALGESSTPLAALSLERLAAAYGLPDLGWLAAAGPWRRRLPQLGRGVKRGFTFYGEVPGEPFRAGADNERRLLVAASPDEEVADAHWLRAEVDAWLVERAIAEGVVYSEATELTAVEIGSDGVRLAGTRDGGAGPGQSSRGAPGGAGPAPAALDPYRPPAGAGEAVCLEADFLVDATGPAGLLAHALELPRRAVQVDTALVYGHFRGVGRFADAVRAAGGDLEAGPYADDRAAVHHLLAEGWLYVLRFDAPGTAAGRDAGSALASAGFVFHRAAAEALADRDPAAVFRALLERYPTLAAQFAGAEAVRPVARVERVAHRLGRAAGERWLVLPHAYAFFDPLFSTGIAWSLLGVERAAELLGGGVPERGALVDYESLLAREADHLELLVRGAWAAMGELRRFAAFTQLYFAAASFAEAAQRIHPRSPTGRAWAWEAFLGASDPAVTTALAGALTRLATDPAPALFERWVRTAIAPRNVAGLADPARRNLYPADLATVLANAHLLAATPEAVRAAMRGAEGPEDG